MKRTGRKHRGLCARRRVIATVVLIIIGSWWPPIVPAQGLLDIGPSLIEEVDIPLSGTFSSSLGWDSDAGSRYSGSGTQGRSATGSEGESVVWQNSLNLNYGFRLKGRNSLGVSAGYTNIWYFDPPPGVDELDHNARLSLGYSRQVNRKLTLRNGLHISYETEPNYDIGLSVTRPTSGYFLASNRLSGTYEWTQRFSTVSGYTFSTVIYEDDSLDNETYYRHRLSQDFRYAFQRRLVGSITYRFGITTYEEDGRSDSVTHTLLAGLDYEWNRRLSVTAHAGVDYRTYDEFDNRAEPRVEVGLRYIVAKRTSARWVNVVALDDTGRSGAQTGYTYRSSLGLGHGFTRRLSSNLSLNYIHSEYGDSREGVEDSSEDTISASVGFGYILWRNISLNANYSYSFITEHGFDDYSRHRAFVGVTYAF